MMKCLETAIFDGAQAPQVGSAQKCKGRDGRRNIDAIRKDIPSWSVGSIAAHKYSLSDF